MEEEYRDIPKTNKTQGVRQWKNEIPGASERLANAEKIIGQNDLHGGPASRLKTVKNADKDPSEIKERIDKIQEITGKDVDDQVKSGYWEGKTIN
ncbi:hypothetical protein CYY_005287 [Polysphondylium violaceum]|uniref:Uncharacterized protein n=1 Tax=Polysphondylium violaceum TaxID=133409 RepID=A0A8J4UZQ4_9MYCE|nr:hypothetical protein CYY_005287 [Polysphondylium violaceum]